MSTPCAASVGSDMKIVPECQFDLPEQGIYRLLPMLAGRFWKIQTQAQAPQFSQFLRDLDCNYP